MTPPRHQTQTERDLDGLDAKKRRELAVPHEVNDPVTGVIPRGPELDAARAKRPTEKRFEHLEQRADMLVDELIASRVFVRRFLWKALGIVGGAITGLIAAYEIGKHAG